MSKTNFERIQEFTDEEMQIFLIMVSKEGHHFFTDSLCKTCAFLDTDECEKQVEAKKCPGTQDDIANWLRSTTW